MSNVNPQTAVAAKDKAEDLFVKGRLREAFETYEQVKAYGEKDPRIFIRMGDIARKQGNASVAVDCYRDAVKTFVKQGFLIKAIAVCKLIISIDPSQEDIQKKLAELAAKGAAPMITPAHAAALKSEAGAGSKPAPVELKRLPKVPLFSDFNEEEFHAIVRIVKARDIAAGDYLFREGDSGDSLFFISEGDVEVIGRAKDGHEISFARLREGDVFGEFGFFSDAVRLTGIKAASRTSVLELTKKDLDEIIQHHKRVGEILINFYKERVVDRLMALSDVFQPLSALDRKEILKRLSIVSCQKGSIIAREGEPGDTMYLIKSGSIAVSVKGKAGQETKLAEMKEGDFFGEIALATNKPRMATITALTDVSLVEFSRPLIKDILGKYPAVKSILERVIKERASAVITARESGALT
ncbi:MAG: cyclic nucleotide-binding domain-containing protein [Deltaproteobacteria bacterium]|nr:cyclic nucleotide-binding domain-containing protein [Deltaproteobacteria bacterium]